MKFPNPSIAQEHNEGTPVQGSGSSIKQYLIGGTCLSVAHTLYMGEPSLTSPVPNVQPYDCSLKMAFLKGTQLKGSNVNICKFMNKLNKKTMNFISDATSIFTNTSALKRWQGAE